MAEDQLESCHLIGLEFLVSLTSHACLQSANHENGTHQLGSLIIFFSRKGTVRPYFSINTSVSRSPSLSQLSTSPRNGNWPRNSVVSQERTMTRTAMSVIVSMHGHGTSQRGKTI